MQATGGPKLAILVDKVMQPQEGWRTKEWMVEEAAGAGFNVFSPRKGYDDLGEVRQVAEWCGKHGLLHMPWMPGTLNAPAGESEGKRLVWADGTEQAIWSPNSEEFWNWMNGYIIEHAKISRESPSLAGVFLDYENYAPGKPRREGNCYPLSYDQQIVSSFGQHAGISIPDMECARRADWLKGRGLGPSFAEYQIDLWRSRCRELRETVDSYNPSFRFCIYPAPGTLFMREACCPEWATKLAPIMLADAASYGRASRFMTQEEALAENRRRLLERIEIPKMAGMPFEYLGGIDPVVVGGDPEFCGRNALSISQITQGYWVFYEGPEYGRDHPDYFRWFERANRAIRDGRTDLWREPRATPDDWGIALRDDGTKRLVALPPQVTGVSPCLEQVEFRYDSTILLGSTPGQEIELQIAANPVGGDGGSVAWEVFDPCMASPMRGAVGTHGPCDIAFTAGTEGVHLLRLSSEECAYRILAANAVLGIYAGRSLTFRRGSPRLYFRVNDEIPRVAIAVRGSGDRTGRIRVFSPDGKPAGEAQTDPERRKAVVDVPVEGYGGIWFLELMQADEGILEDVSIQFTGPPALLPVVALNPQHAFTGRPTRS